MTKLIAAHDRELQVPLPTFLGVEDVTTKLSVLLSVLAMLAAPAPAGSSAQRFCDAHGTRRNSGCELRPELPKHDLFARQPLIALKMQRQCHQCGFGFVQESGLYSCGEVAEELSADEVNLFAGLDRPGCKKLYARKRGQLMLCAWGIDIACPHQTFDLLRLPRAQVCKFWCYCPVSNNCRERALGQLCYTSQTFEAC